jgi:hypothetical protein
MLTRQYLLWSLCCSAALANLRGADESADQPKQLNRLLQMDCQSLGANMGGAGGDCRPMGGSPNQRMDGSFLGITPSPTSPKPSTKPTVAPVPAPTIKPTTKPTSVPVPAPTSKPTTKPTSVPVPAPTTDPIPVPDQSAQPTAKPTASPVKVTPLPNTPTVRPTPAPTPTFAYVTPPPQQTNRFCPSPDSAIWQSLPGTQACRRDSDCAGYLPQFGTACCQWPQCVCTTITQSFRNKGEQCVNFNFEEQV